MSNEPTEAQIAAAAKAYVEHREGAGRWEVLSPGAKQHAMEVCQKILCAAFEGLPCIFCGELTGEGNEVHDREGNVACLKCGKAEIAAQTAEGLWPATADN